MISIVQVGYHESPQSVYWLSAENEGCRTFQVMLGSPRTYLVKPLTKETVQHMNSQGLTVIAHGPYVTSLVSNNPKMAGLSKKFLWDFTKCCIQSNIKHIVMHVGGLAEGQTPREGLAMIEGLLLQWLMDFGQQDVVLCLETDPGSKNGRRCGGVKFLYKVVKDMDSPNIRICWDWEHSYANGFSLENLKVIDQLLDYTDVVHMNAIPHYVEQGSHLDRHSTTYFEDSKYPTPVYQTIWNMMKDKDHQLYGILERESWGVARIDYNLVRSWEQ